MYAIAFVPNIYFDLSKSMFEAATKIQADQRQIFMLIMAEWTTNAVKREVRMRNERKERV